MFHTIDVRKIVSEEVLTDAFASGVARVANLKTGKIVSTPSGNKVAITAAAEIDSTHYFDPLSASTFALDHLQLVRFSTFYKSLLLGAVDLFPCYFYLS